MDMKNILSHDPFSIKDENTCTLIARYLIEPSEEEYVIFDMGRTQEWAVTKSVFRKLVGNYQLIDERAEKALADSVDEVTST